MIDNQDKRYFPRTPVSLAVHVQASEKRFAVETIDLTVHGISFKSEQALSVGSKITIDIDGSEEIRNNELTAEILRCDPLSNETPLRYFVAGKFNEANDEFLMDALALVHGKKAQS